MAKRRKRKKTARGKIGQVIDNSFINYFSDLFIVAMVSAWIVVLTVMVFVAIYATIRLADTTMWSDVGTLVAVPLSCGGAIWMVKNSVQHAIANRAGKEVRYDFPAVNADGEDDGAEESIFERPVEDERGEEEMEETK